MMLYSLIMIDILFVTTIYTFRLLLGIDCLLV